MIDLLEGVEKFKESEKIMTTKDFHETGEKVKSIFIFMGLKLIFYQRKSINSRPNPWANKKRNKIK